jgi:ParB family chromosome partitioning protein
MKFPAFEPIELKNEIADFAGVELLLSQIVPDEHQHRRVFDEKALKELALSIQQHGVIQPIIVKKIDGSEKYQLVAGERRWRAAKRAGLEKIPAIVRVYTELDSMAVALIENIQRKNLNPLEEAQAVEKLLTEFQLTHQQIAEHIGKSRVTVSNLLRLLRLESEVKALLEAGLLEMGHARALLGLTGQQQVACAQQVVKQCLSVRATEKLLQHSSNASPTQSVQLAPDFEQKVSAWKKRASQLLAAKVNLHFSPNGKGKLVIRFNSLTDADRLMDHITLSDLQL